MRQICIRNGHINSKKKKFEHLKIGLDLIDLIYLIIKEGWHCSLVAKIIPAVSKMQENSFFSEPWFGSSDHLFSKPGKI